MHPSPTPPGTPGAEAPLRVLFCNWRDTRNPEGGGSEVYVESVATALAAAGHDVTILCAAHANAPADEVVDGVRFVRARQQARRLPAGLPAAAAPPASAASTSSSTCRTASRSCPPGPAARPVVVLVHHVHREQWPVVYGPVRSRIGWWIESRLAPRAYRGSPLRRRLGGHPRGARRARASRGDDITWSTTASSRPRLDPAPADRPAHRSCSAGSCRTSGSSTCSAAAAELRARPPRPAGRASSATAGGPTQLPRTRDRLGVERPRRVHRLRRRGGQARAAGRAPGCSPCPRSRRAGVWS